MSNTSLFMEGDYNLSKIISSDVINSPEKWLLNWNVELGGWGIFAILAVIGLILFFTMRRQENVKDSEAATYAGFIVSVASLLLLLIKVDGSHIISWENVFPLWVITGLAILVDRVNRRF